jgi:hypothetical protein
LNRVYLLPLPSRPLSKDECSLPRFAALVPLRGSSGLDLAVMRWHRLEFAHLGRSQPAWHLDRVRLLARQVRRVESARPRGYGTATKSKEPRDRICVSRGPLMWKSGTAMCRWLVLPIWRSRSRRQGTVTPSRLKNLPDIFQANDVPAI